MTLQAECRKAILDTLKKEGMPPIIDKTYNSIWETFMKTQPHILSGAGADASGQLDGANIYGNLEHSMTKFGIQANIAQKVIKILKKKFGDNPNNADVKLFLC